MAWALAAITLASAGRAQDPPDPADIDALVTRFVKTSDEYQKVFLNLVAEETKVAENFDQSGRLKRRREIVSDLVVYRSHDAKDTAEYRDVLSVDGKPVGKRTRRALEVLTRASQATSIQKELDLINREGQRYDLGFSTDGATINQIPGAVLASREEIRIDWVGRDQIAGHDVIVLDYREKTPNRDHSDAKFYTRYGFSGGIMRGRLWLDAATAQLRRDRWELVYFLPALKEPVVFVRQESSYTESRFGILAPERIVFEVYAPAKAAKNQPPSWFRTARITATFGAFRQFEVATQQTIGAPVQPQH
jgi:hypothetical protein